MQITFDTTTITDDEVRGISALLYTVRPSAFDTGPFSTEGVAQAVEEKLADQYASGGPVMNFSTTLVDEVPSKQTARVPRSDDPDLPEHLQQTAPNTDSTGLPWDERIHASSKALNADGTWRTKRNVDKALVAEVEAELRSRTTVTREITETGVDEEGFVTIEPVVTVAPPAPPAQEVPKAPLAPAATVTEPAMSTEQTGNGSAPAPVAPSSAVSPFVALMKRVTTAQGAGKLTQPRVKELLESLDKKSIMDLRTDEDALASFAVLLDGEGV